MFPIYLFAIAIVVAFIHLKASKAKVTFIRSIEVLLAYLLPITIGIGGFIGYLSHSFYGQEVARTLGYPANDPFQFQIGMANLALGVLGLLSIWERKGFWAALVLANAIFLMGSAYGFFTRPTFDHIIPANSEILFYVWMDNVILPAITLILTFIYGKKIHLFNEKKQGKK